MRDAAFKALAHCTGNNQVASLGTQVSSGYKPDITVRAPNGDLLFILECEQKTDRKAFLGAFLKAEMYAEQQKARPELVFVMQAFKNTTTSQIVAHIRPYFAWLSRLKNGQLSLAAVQVLLDTEYQSSVIAGEPLGSAAFKRRGLRL